MVRKCKREFKGEKRKGRLKIYKKSKKNEKILNFLRSSPFPLFHSFLVSAFHLSNHSVHFTSSNLKHRIKAYNLLQKLQEQSTTPQVQSSKTTGNIKLAKLLNCRYTKSKPNITNNHNRNNLSIKPYEKLAGYTQLSHHCVSNPRPITPKRIYSKLPILELQSLIKHSLRNLDYNTAPFVEFNNEFEEDPNVANEPITLQATNQWHLKNVENLFDISILSSIAKKMKTVGWPIDLKNRQVFDEVWSLLLRVLLCLCGPESADIREMLEDVEFLTNILIQILVVQATHGCCVNSLPRLNPPPNHRGLGNDRRWTVNIENVHGSLGFDKVYRVGQISIRKQMWSSYGQ